ncbi:ABC transporter substrate-binding protein [Halalkalicoccus sp. NIPERK01]|uniref:ABC transporter substrate-binding protein n=1 Tax=Halalkalicoccus sp. NIPERK01 TaxID=3053469 RepID=UPI00256EBD4D|nr:ABC transporter substrate-binding protein [Halalkalicoccus sp. NIPERK01]MDL5362477.1 ABC transporter substrate-binding protein [Halalkalicoccus sp. NIPERK01]
MQQTRRAFIGAIGGAALAGCTAERDPGIGGGGSTGGQDEGESDTPAPEVASVSMVLNWRIGGLHAPYFAALENGFYADEGFESVDIESGQGSDFAAQQVGVGNAEFALTSPDQVLNVTSKGLAPQCVGVLMQRNPVVVFSARENFGEPLEGADQLRGRTLGSGPGMVRQMTEVYLDSHGVLDAVEYVDSGFDTVQQLLTGEIDAAAGVFSDVVDAEHQGYAIDALPIAETIPSYGHLLAVEEAFGGENPETVASFLRATARGAVHASQHPEEAIDALVAAQPELEEVRENQRDKWDAMRTEYMVSETVREQGWGASDPETWRETYATLDAGGFFEESVDPDAAWTNDYLDTGSEYVADYADLVGE